MAVDPRHIEEIVRSVDDENSFIQRLLIDGLKWEIPLEAEDLGEITYDWTPQELQIEGLEAHLADGVIKQIVLPGNPWGVFILEFNNPELFATGRGMTGPLRKLLRALVPKKRGSRPDQPVFQQENLLFICNHDYQHFRFAHFKVPLDTGKAAPLAAFGWGPHDPVRTVCEFNLPALVWPETTPPDDAGWIECWGAAFDVEKVTKKFYRDYKDTFEAFERYIAGRPDTGGLTGDDLRLWCQMLFNRLMFIRFIERKGWLTFPDQRGTNYLAALFEAANCDGESFYRGRLRRLFFEGLAIEGQQNAPAYGNVPFLNGGLFEETDFDKSVQDIPDDALRGVLGDEHAGGLFYRYNFTVEESTPLDIEVAVDPEMLGKVFEELVTGRHETGSYYTPRPIVSFMCREAIKGHLTGKSQASPEAISALVDEHRIAKGFTVHHARQIIEALDNLKAVDPACGSGAYLLGLLHELIAIYRLVYSEKLTEDTRSLYDLKLRIISNNLYGVDIDPFATNIAMLRLWLSLAVEAHEPVPLPNLAFKIETGDSLLSPDPQEMPDLFRPQLHAAADELAAMKNQYLLARGIEKESYFRSIKHAESRLREGLQAEYIEEVVDWRIQFAEAFAFRRGGFDLVLANPPYIRMELFRDIKPTLREVYATVHTDRADLYVYFYARGLQLLRPNGMIVFISPNNWFRAGYGKKLRKHVANICQVCSITDFGELPVFEAVATFPMIFVAQKCKPHTTTTYTQVKSLEPPYPNVLAITQHAGNLLPEHAIQGSHWTLTNPTRMNFLRKMEATGLPLGEYTKGKIYWGVKSGYNAAFVIDGESRSKLLAADSRSSEIIKPLVVGDDVRKWHVKRKERWLLYMYHGIDADRYRTVISFLRPHRERLEHRATNQKWYELQQPQMRYEHSLMKPKILFPDIAKESRFTLNTTGAFVANTVYFIPGNDLYLLSVLNSSVIWSYAKERLTVLGDAHKGGRLRFFRHFTERIPIPKASQQEQGQLCALARKCLKAEGNDCQEWETEINDIVSRLYGIQPSQVKFKE